ncbi:MAG: MBL fold metallo-hydrolase [Pseudomonadota bacterium]
MKTIAGVLNRTLTGIVAGSLALTSAANAANLTEENAERTSAIIEAAIATYGGSDGLAALTSVIIENEDTGYATGQSLKPEPPWDKNYSRGMSAIDFENDIFVNVSSGDGGGFEFHNGTIINGNESFQINYRAGTAQPLAQPDFDTASGPLIRVTPALLVRQLQENARTAHFLGEVDVDGKAHEVVGFSMAVGPAISLYFDKMTHLLNRSERFIPGIGLVEYRFYDQEPVDGIPFNSRFELYLNGDANIERKILSTKLNVPVAPLARPEEDLEIVAALEPDPLTRQALADGVYLIGGSGTYAMFVEMDDFVVAFGGTAGIPERIDLLREVVPDKPIRYGVMTHHHFDHVVGVQPYAEEGATVIAAAAHEQVVRDAAEDSEALSLKLVGDRDVIRNGGRVIEIIDIGPTAHTEHLLVGWLPKERILFEADHFAMPRSGPVPPAVQSTRSFAIALREFELNPAMIVSAHSPRPGTMDDLEDALDKEVARQAAIFSARCCTVSQFPGLAVLIPGS